MARLRRAAGGEDIPLWVGESNGHTCVVVAGEPCAKANSREIMHPFTTGGRRTTAVIKSTEARQYVAAARRQLQRQWQAPPLEGRIRLKLHVYYGTLRKDLDESLVLDAMQGIVYRNDRQVVERHTYRGHSTVPRTVVWIEELRFRG